MRLGDDQIVDVELMVVLGIGDRRFQALAHVARDALAREFQIGQRARDLLAADQLRHQIELLRADPQHPGDCLGLGIGERALACFLAHRLSVSMLRPEPLLRGRRCTSRLALWSDVGRRRSASARTHRTCGRPSLQSRDRNVLLAVVDAERQPDELRQDGRAPAPDPDHFVTPDARDVSAFLSR